MISRNRSSEVPENDASTCSSSTSATDCSWPASILTCSLYDARILLTFDNLGEASELERGTWDGRIPLGQHPSVTVALPRLLDELDELGLTATFFVEAINCELNPEAVRSIVDRGHELGMHAWSHEPWAPLGPDRERELFERSMDAFASIELRPVAFRPPGGGLTEQTPQLLVENGFRWCSPLQTAVPVQNDQLRWAPFDWELVDAYHLMERFDGLRLGRGDTEQPLTAADTERRLAAALSDDEAAGQRAGGPRVLILHPFLMLDDDWWQGARRVLRTAKRLGARPSP